MVSSSGGTDASAFVILPPFREPSIIEEESKPLCLPETEVWQCKNPSLTSCGMRHPVIKQAQGSQSSLGPVTGKRHPELTQGVLPDFPGRVPTLPYGPKCGGLVEVCGTELRSPGQERGPFISKLQQQEPICRGKRRSFCFDVMLSPMTERTGAASSSCSAKTCSCACFCCLPW